MHVAIEARCSGVVVTLPSRVTVTNAYNRTCKRACIHGHAQRGVLMSVHVLIRTTELKYSSTQRLTLRSSVGVKGHPVSAPAIFKPGRNASHTTRPHRDAGTPSMSRPENRKGCSIPRRWRTTSKCRTLCGERVSGGWHFQMMRSRRTLSRAPPRGSGNVARPRHLVSFDLPTTRRKCSPVCRTFCLRGSERSGRSLSCKVRYSNARPGGTCSRSGGSVSQTPLHWYW
jgi:hypothetical protein